MHFRSLQAQNLGAKLIQIHCGLLRCYFYTVAIAKGFDTRSIKLLLVAACCLLLRCCLLLLVVVIILVDHICIEIGEGEIVACCCYHHPVAGITARNSLGLRILLLLLSPKLAWVSCCCCCCLLLVVAVVVDPNLARVLVTCYWLCLLSQDVEHHGYWRTIPFLLSRYVSVTSAWLLGRLGIWYTLDQPLLRWGITA